MRLRRSKLPPQPRAVARPGAFFDPMMRNVYRGPAFEMLNDQTPDTCLLLGSFEIDSVEISTAQTDEGAFITLLHARFTSTIDDMVAALRAPTFPVHDEPGR